MKYLWMILAILALSCTSAMAQKTGAAKAKTSKGVTTTSFKAYGNCGMCERRIEGAVNEMTGVISSDWSADTDMLAVKYDPKKVNLQQIKEKVAGVGHDTDDVRAKDEVYDKLHGCCKYERPQKN